MRGLAIAFALAFVSNSGIAQSRSDSCEGQVPRSLASLLERTFPGYRVPLEYDNAPEDIAHNKSQGGLGCLGVGAADFTGEGKKDYVIGMTAVKGGGGLAVIALPKKGGWQLRRIQSWPEHRRASQYVDVVPPGKYRRSESATTALAKDERQFLTCTNSGVRVGTIGATATVYCFVEGQWLHVQVSD